MAPNSSGYNVVHDSQRAQISFPIRLIFCPPEEEKNLKTFDFIISSDCLILNWITSVFHVALSPENKNNRNIRWYK